MDRIRPGVPPAAVAEVYEQTQVHACCAQIVQALRALRAAQPRHGLQWGQFRCFNQQADAALAQRPLAGALES